MQKFTTQCILTASDYDFVEAFTNIIALNQNLSNTKYFGWFGLLVSFLALVVFIGGSKVSIENFGKILPATFILLFISFFTFSSSIYALAIKEPQIRESIQQNKEAIKGKPSPSNDIIANCVDDKTNRALVRSKERNIELIRSSTAKQSTYEKVLNTEVFD